MSGPGVELRIYSGVYGEKTDAVALQIDAELMRELQGKVELSDDPFSILLASPGMLVGHGDAVTIRREKFKMRKAVAEQIAKAMVPALLNAFGVNDELDGYRVDGMSSEERAWHKLRGRL